MAPPRITPTKASSWKRPEQEVVTLPSGNKAKLRRPQIIPMLQRGEIPNPLMHAALQATDGVGDMEEIDPKDAIDFMAWVVSQAFVDPEVVVIGENADRHEVAEDAVPEGTLAFSDLDDEDVQFVVNWWQRGSIAFEPFRDESAGDPDGSNGGAVLDPALAVAGD